jgi:hypothetical protein
LEHFQLMVEREDLEVQRGTRTLHASERRQEGNPHGGHRQQRLPVPADNCNGLNTHDLFGRHT